MALAILREEEVVLVGELAMGGILDGHASPSSVLLGYRNTRSPLEIRRMLSQIRYGVPSFGKAGVAGRSPRPRRVKEDRGRGKEPFQSRKELSEPGKEPSQTGNALS
jgi:hypothetical protein